MARAPSSYSLRVTFGHCQWAMVSLFLSHFLLMSAQSEQSLDPGTALGSTDLVWTTGGNAPWFVTENVFDAGSKALASGAIENNQTSWIETTVTGPGVLVYRWAVSSEPRYDELEFSVDGTIQRKYSGVFPWDRSVHEIEATGPVVLRWTYVKDESVSFGRDQGYLDQVLWIPSGQGGLNVQLQGNGSGRVEIAPNSQQSIDCGPQCVMTFDLPQTLDLVATADTGSSFVQWGGACSSINDNTSNNCQVSLESLSEVTATFSKDGQPEAIENNQPASSISGRALSIRRFYVDVPVDARDLVIRVDAQDDKESNSAFLQVAHGRLPTSSDHDCFPLVTGSRQVCAFSAPQAGRYHIVIGGQSNEFSGIEVLASYFQNGTTHNVSVTATGNGRVVSSNVEFPVIKVADSIYSTQVVGGGDTTIEQWPWQVQLFRFVDSTPYCSGALIDREWVVTAAHCFDNRTPSIIWLGRTNLTSGGIDADVAQVIVHEGYEKDSFEKDIALVRLATPVQYGPSIAPIAPLSAEQEGNLAQDGVLGSVTGWGLLYPFTDVRPNALQLANVAMLSPEACRNTQYSSTSITDNMICAGFVEGGVDACRGDSGGPLVVRDGLGGHRLAGITSWGEGCAQPGYPGVYTRISAFVDWISEQTGLTFSDKILDCGDTCEVTVPEDTQLTLVPEPDPGYFFVGFDGICAGQLTCSLTIDQARTINAAFQAEAIFQDRFESQ